MCVLPSHIYPLADTRNSIISPHSAETEIFRLRDAGFAFALENDRLFVEPFSRLTADDLKFLKARKAECIAFLRRERVPPSLPVERVSPAAAAAAVAAVGVQVNIDAHTRAGVIVRILKGEPPAAKRDDRDDCEGGLTKNLSRRK